METENVKRNAAVILSGMFSRHGSNSSGMTEEAVRIAFEIERLVDAKVSDGRGDGMPRPSLERLAQGPVEDAYADVARRMTTTIPTLTERQFGKAPELAMGFGSGHDDADGKTPEEIAARFAKDD